MKRRTLRYFILVSLLFTVQAALWGIPYRLEDERQILKLKNYRFHHTMYSGPEDARRIAGLSFHDQAFVAYDNGRLPAFTEKGLRLYTFKTRFTVAEHLRGQLFDLYVAPVESPYALYVNGEQLGVMGRYEGQYNSFKFEAVSFNIPESLLSFGPDQVNELTVQVFSLFERNALSDIVLGTHYPIETRVFLRNLFTRSFHQMVVMLTLVISVYFFYIHLLSDRSVYKYLFFALTCFFYTLANINLFVNWESAREILLLKISRTGFVVTAAFLFMFSASFCGRLRRLRKWLTPVSAGLVVTGVLIVVQGEKEGIWRIFNTLGIGYIALLNSASAVFLFLAVKKGVKGAVFILGGLGILIVFSLFDMYELASSITPYFWRVPYGYFILCLTVFYVLAFEHSLVLAKSREQARALTLINQEIVKREKVEQELIRARDEAYRANEVKSEFLANMSHEIRTPLNGIVGFAELLAYSNNPEEQEHCTRQILAESEHLMTLLNDVLDLSKIEAGKLNLIYEPVCIREFTRRLFNSIQAIARKKGLDAVLHIDPEVPEFVEGDPMRLNQILRNLLTNAVKFTEKGQVYLSVTATGFKNSDIRLCFTVRDTGIGIPEDFLPLLFDSFVQVDSTSTRSYGGSGLGTAIAKQLVDLMKGTISVQSRVGEGSTFTVTVPARVVREPAAGREKTGDRKLHGTRHALVLLVEDYRPNQIIAMSHLKAIDCDVLLAGDGEEAVRLFSDHPVDLVLMDIQLPKMDGLEATRIIKSTPQGQEVPVIALTANSGPELRRECFAAGMTDVITKPFRRNAFLAKINGVLENEYLVREETPVLTEGFSLAQAFENLVDEAGGDKEAAVGMVDAFLASAGLQLTLMKNSGLSNPELVRKEAHKIKGGALNLFWEPLARCASLIEEGVKNGIANYTDLIEDLETEYYAVKIEWGGLRAELTA
ncbi:MAG: response regulator [Spirochaetales bacterium]|nr:response regulator [Spirochaetales bacterium]